jgi:hypothetical protein
MKTHRTSVVLMVAALAVFLAVAKASADDPKKPAAIAASTASSSTSVASAKTKPAAVQASTAKASTKGSTDKPLTLATHLYVKDAAVPLREKMGADGKVYKIATKLHEVDLTIEGHGTEATFGTTIKTKGEQDKQPEYEGLTAFQILVEQKYFEYVDGVGFVPTKSFAKFADISVSSGSGGENDTANNGNQNKNTAPGLLGVKGGPDFVAPPTPESVAEDPSQKGGLFGMGYDGPIDNYDPSDPNTPEGKRKILRDRLSELSRACWDTPEANEYLSCLDNCNNLLFSDAGRISQDRVDECRRNCKAIFERDKPQVCHDSDEVEAQLKQLGDER